MTLPDSHAHGPGGPRPIEHFHALGEGAVLEKLRDGLRKIAEDRPHLPPVELPGVGRRDDDDDDASSTDGSAAEGQPATGDAASTSQPQPGWVQWAGWTNATGKLLTLCSGSFTVPPPPEDPGDQVIFLFIGLQAGKNDGSELYQAVLQWGPSAAGGGKYWAVSCWYLHQGRLIFSPLIRVAAGEVLETRVERTAKNKMGSSWECVATARNSGASTRLPVVGDVRLGWVNTTLEAYSPAISCSQFPRTNSTAFRQLLLRSGDEDLVPAWEPEVRYAGCNNQVLIEGPEETRLIYQ